VAYVRHQEQEHAECDHGEHDDDGGMRHFRVGLYRRGEARLGQCSGMTSELAAPDALPSRSWERGLVGGSA
jgi:hypothetical protein